MPPWTWRMMINDGHPGKNFKTECTNAKKISSLYSSNILFFHLRTFKYKNRYFLYWSCGVFIWWVKRLKKITIQLFDYLINVFFLFQVHTLHLPTTLIEYFVLLNIFESCSKLGSIMEQFFTNSGLLLIGENILDFLDHEDLMTFRIVCRIFKKSLDNIRFWMKKCSRKMRNNTRNTVFQLRNEQIRNEWINFSKRIIGTNHEYNFLKMLMVN